MPLHLANIDACPHAVRPALGGKPSDARQMLAAYRGAVAPLATPEHSATIALVPRHAPIDAKRRSYQIAVQVAQEHLRDVDAHITLAVDNPALLFATSPHFAPIARRMAKLGKELRECPRATSGEVLRFAQDGESTNTGSRQACDDPLDVSLDDEQPPIAPMHPHTAPVAAEAENVVRSYFADEGINDPLALEEMLLAFAPAPKSCPPGARA